MIKLHKKRRTLSSSHAISIQQEPIVCYFKYLFSFFNTSSKSAFDMRYNYTREESEHLVVQVRFTKKSNGNEEYLIFTLNERSLSFLKL